MKKPDNRFRRDLRRRPIWRRNLIAAQIFSVAKEKVHKKMLDAILYGEASPKPARVLGESIVEVLAKTTGLSFPVFKAVLTERVQ